ncbi:MAG: FtsX-like permease family protein [Solirubrobacterales bacterium]|nr:FtsX-like permease family protein [Solirubrobacterales bacterium]
MALETLRTAWVGLMSHRLRTALTVLGITIGIASVIVLIAVGKGSSDAVQESIDELGSNTLTVSATGTGETSGGAPVAVTLEKADVEALEDAERAPAIKSVSPVVSASGTELVYGSATAEPGEFVGTTPSYFEAHNYSVESGSFFTEAQVKERARVAVIGPEVATELFPGEGAVGKTMQVNGVNYEVVAVTKSKGSSGTQSQDDGVFAPVTAVEDTLAGYGELSSIAVEATSKDAVADAEAQITQVLNERHGISEGINVINQSSIIEASSSSESVFTTLLSWVAAISLLVGGIGVMNIMLVSVTERTREIGIRKAIGARRGDILAQFLCEALLVSAIGGLLGIAVGLVGSQFEIAGVQPKVAAYSVILAAAASLGSGLFFGTYPAMRAARLRPIEALRFD